jgi:hypothetical protein
MMDGTQEQGKRRFFGLNVTLVVSRLYTEERESPIVAHSRMKDGQQTWQAGAGQQTYIYTYIRDELCFIITRSCLSTQTLLLYV